MIDAHTGRPLANADVIDRLTNTVSLTDARGVTRMLITGSLHVRIRQIGYQAAERELEAPASIGDTTTIALTRVALQLPGVLTTAEATCPTSAASGAALGAAAPGAVAAAVLQQIRTAAERYDSFRRTYPFRVRVERRSAEVRRDGTAPRIVVSRGTADSDEYAEPYAPGSLVRRERRGFSVPVLFVTTLADPRFLTRHCFVVHGVESLDTARVLRLDFSSAPSVQEADWAGVVFIDSATSLLRRIEFRLDHLRPGDTPARLEGYTTFRSPSPYVVLPESTMAGWWRSPPDERDGHAWGPPDAVQLLRVESVEYQKARPPT